MEKIESLNTSKVIYQSNDKKDNSQEEFRKWKNIKVVGLGVARWYAPLCCRGLTSDVILEITILFES